MLMGNPHNIANAETPFMHTTFIKSTYYYVLSFLQLVKCQGRDGYNDNLTCAKVDIL